MTQFTVDDDLVELVWRLANPRPFENLSFSNALRRVLADERKDDAPPRKPSIRPADRTADELLAELDGLGKDGLAKRGIVITRRQRAPSPSPESWVRGIPELRSVAGLTSWKAICDHLEIDVGGDSARRKLQDWAKTNRQAWPPVPDV